MRGSDLTVKQTGLSTVMGQARRAKDGGPEPRRGRDGNAPGECCQEGGVREERVLLSGAAAQH